MQRSSPTIAGLLAVLGLMIQAVQAADPPGVIIDRSPDFQRVYIGSPSIALLPDGAYVASHDWFGPGTDYNRTAVAASKDQGTTWQPIAEIEGLFWPSLFVHRGDLYAFGTSKRYGDVVIRRSRDGGRTWTKATDSRSGRLLTDAGFHCAPVPVVVHGGRIWRAFEDDGGGQRWPGHFRAFVMSAPVDADLLVADNWTVSNRLAMKPEWLDAKRPGWLEGNVVAAPDGSLLNILRVNDDRGDRAALVDISDDGRTLSFDPENGFIDFPGGRTKFTIRFDPKSQRYWSLVNKQRNPTAYRNVLALTSSADLRNWEVESIILRHVDTEHHAWQYPDWVFDGDDIIAASRTGWDGSHNAHDANFLTFHRIENFRRRTMADSPPYLGREELSLAMADFEVQGYGVRLGKLDNGQLAYGNRKYVWQEVPETFRGWRITQTRGGEPAEIIVRAKRDTLLHVATAAAQEGIDMTGWKPTGQSFLYTCHARTQMQIFQRRLSAGETVEIPQGNWSGTIVLLPPEAEKR